MNVGTLSTFGVVSAVVWLAARLNPALRNRHISREPGFQLSTGCLCGTRWLGHPRNVCAGAHSRAPRPDDFHRSNHRTGLMSERPLHGSG